ncbi:MAG TPA: Gfo/Idh/MocA family oxidoreductase [Myxococcota bacterium]
MPQAKLRVALIGAEFMGRAHANAWRQAPRFFELPREPVLQVVCARDAAKLAARAARLGFAEHATDWRATIRRPDVDVVDICTPGDSHAEIAIAAAQAGKAILCEKPLANTVAEAEAMAHAVREAGVPNLVCHNYRRAPAVALAKRILDEGRLGAIRHYRGAYLQDWIVDPAFPRVWRLERARAGSGALGDIGSHQVDLARHLLGEISAVSGLLETFIAERPLPGGGGRGHVDVDDAALALLRFASGAIGSLEGTRFATGRKNANRFEVNGARGSLAFDLERMNELELYEEQGPSSGFRTVLATDPSHPYAEAWWPPGHGLGYEHTFVHTVADFTRAIARGEPASPSFEDGLATQRVLATIERSAESQRWEAVA